MNPTQSPTPGTIENLAGRIYDCASHHANSTYSWQADPLDAEGADRAHAIAAEQHRARGVARIDVLLREYAALSAPPLKQEAEAHRLSEAISGLRYFLMVKEDRKFVAGALDSLLRLTASQPPSSQGEPDMAKDAARYRWLREQQWDTAKLFVISGSKSLVRLGTDCPSLERLDAAIDSSMAAAKGEERAAVEGEKTGGAIE